VEQAWVEQAVGREWTSRACRRSYRDRHGNQTGGNRPTRDAGRTGEERWPDKAKLPSDDQKANMGRERGSAGRTISSLVEASVGGRPLSASMASEDDSKPGADSSSHQAGPEMNR
jgi:hypothetical protein